MDEAIGDCLFHSQQRLSRESFLQLLHQAADNWDSGQTLKLRSRTDSNTQTQQPQAPMQHNC